jgi:hypothetical protein
VICQKDDYLLNDSYAGLDLAQLCQKVMASIQFDESNYNYVIGKLKSW